MPEPPQPRLADLYHFDPTTMELTHQNPDGSIVTADFRNLKGGQLENIGLTLRNPQTNRLQGSLSPNRITDFITFGEGDLYKLNPIDLGDANRPATADTITGLSLDFDMTLPNGEVLHAGDVFMTIHPVGQALAYRPNPNGTRTVEGIDVSLIDYVAGTVEGRPELRLLSGEDAAYRAMVGILTDRYKDELGRLLNTGVIDESGHLMDNIYELARFLARINGSGAALGRLTGV